MCVLIDHLSSLSSYHFLIISSQVSHRVPMLRLLRLTLPRMVSLRVCVLGSLQMAVCVRERVGFGGGNHGDGRRRREHKALCLLTLPLFPPPVRYASSVSGPKDVVLVLDRSGSMNAKISKAPGQTKSRITAAKDAANWVINTLSYVVYLVIGVVLSSVEGDSGRSIARQRSYRVIPSSSTDRVSFRLFLPPSPPSSLLLSLFFYPRPPSHSSDHSGTLTTPPL